MLYFPALVETKLDLANGNSHYFQKLPEDALIGEETSNMWVDLFEIFLNHWKRLLIFV